MEGNFSADQSAKEVAVRLYMVPGRPPCRRVPRPEDGPAPLPGRRCGGRVGLLTSIILRFHPLRQLIGGDVQVITKALAFVSCLLFCHTNIITVASLIGSAPTCELGFILRPWMFLL
jgi:hypothetical protein